MTKQKKHGIKRKFRDSLHDQNQNEVIQKWRDERLKKMNSRKPYSSFYVHSFSLKTLQSFTQNFNFMVLIQMLCAGVAVYVFQTYNIWFDLHVTLFVSPIVFPLAFSINTDFQRREKVLEDLAQFKSSGMIWYFCMRDWKQAAQLDKEWFSIVHAKRRSVLFHIREFLLTYKQERRKIILRSIYEDFSDMNQLIEKLRASKLPANSAIISRAIHLLNMMCLSFERLRVIREYRSPRSIRSFNKVLIMILPVILSPYFVHIGFKSKSKWEPYVISVLVAFVFSALQGVQDKLDDPFDGMSEDDIQLDTFDEWNNSLEYVLKRKVYSIRTIKDNIEKYCNNFKMSFDEMVHIKKEKPQTYKPTTNPSRIYTLHDQNSFPQLRGAGVSISSLTPSENYITGHMVHGVSGLMCDSIYTPQKSSNNRLYQSFSRDKSDGDTEINKRHWIKKQKNTGYEFKDSIAESCDEKKDGGEWCHKTQGTFFKTSKKQSFPVATNKERITKEQVQNGCSTETSDLGSDVICTNKLNEREDLGGSGGHNDVISTYFEPEPSDEIEAETSFQEEGGRASSSDIKFPGDKGQISTGHNISRRKFTSTGKTNRKTQSASVTTKNDVITVKTDNSRPNNTEIQIIISSHEKSDDDSFTDDSSVTTIAYPKRNAFFSETIISENELADVAIISKQDGVLVASSPSRHSPTNQDTSEQRKAPTTSSWNILNKNIKRKFFANGRHVSGSKET